MIVPVLPQPETNEQSPPIIPSAGSVYFSGEIYMK